MTEKQREAVNNKADSKHVKTPKSSKAEDRATFTYDRYLEQIGNLTGKLSDYIDAKTGQSLLRIPCVTPMGMVPDLLLAEDNKKLVQRPVVCATKVSVDISCVLPQTKDCHPVKREDRHPIPMGEVVPIPAAVLQHALEANIAYNLDPATLEPVAEKSDSPKRLFVIERAEIETVEHHFQESPRVALMRFYLTANDKSVPSAVELLPAVVPFPRDLKPELAKIAHNNQETIALWSRAVSDRRGLGFPALSSRAASQHQHQLLYANPVFGELMRSPLDAALLSHSLGAERLFPKVIATTPSVDKDRLVAYSPRSPSARALYGRLIFDVVASSLKTDDMKKIVVGIKNRISSAGLSVTQEEFTAALEKLVRHYEPSRHVLKQNELALAVFVSHGTGGPHSFHARLHLHVIPINGIVRSGKYDQEALEDNKRSTEARQTHLKLLNDMMQSKLSLSAAVAVADAHTGVDGDGDSGEETEDVTGTPVVVSPSAPALSAAATVTAGSASPSAK